MYFLQEFFLTIVHQIALSTVSGWWLVVHHQVLSIIFVYLFSIRSAVKLAKITALLQKIKFIFERY